MRRPPAIMPAHDLRALKRIFHVCLAVVACSGLIASFPVQTRAQTPEAGCSDGLIRRNDTGTGELLLKTSIPGCYFPAPRVAADFTIDISGPVARTRVTQRFENPADGWVEGIYLFPLPEGAAVDTLKMKVGERLIEGQIKEREEARQIYEAAKAEGKRASLVEQERPNVFTNSVANIGPHETIVVQIEYQESLRFDARRYHLRVPLVVAPRFNPAPSATLVRYREGAQFTAFDPVPDRHRLEAPVLKPEAGKVNPVTFALAVEAGFPIGPIVSESHHILVVRDGDTRARVALAEPDVPADRDFVFSFAPKDGTAPAVSLLKEQKEDGDYYLALIMPRANENRAAQLPRETIFVLDNSGSMGGESIRQAKAGLLLGLDRLTLADRFNVIRFDDTMSQLYPRAVPATPSNVAFAKGYVSSIEANGGTVMLPALVAALKDEAPNDRSYLRQVIFLTDGQVGNEAELFSAIDESLGRTRLFTVGIGSAPNSHFMSGAARAGRGTFTYIGSTDQVTTKMVELFVKLERPVMTDLAAEWPNGALSEAWPNPLPDLYAGEPVVVTFKTTGNDGALLLKGNREGTPWEVRLVLSQAAEGKGIERLWARNKIAALEESRVLGVDLSEIDHEVLNVALAHHLMSRLTSLVAVDVVVARQPDELLALRQVPLNLPAGWDFDKVFGESVRVPERRADAGIPDTLLMKLDLRTAPPGAVQPQDAGLVLPQGSTPAPLMQIAGLVLLLLAGLVLTHQRNVNAGAR
jgi:Ca-activated chloride channel family protein